MAGNGLLAKRMAAMGRYGDTEMVHATPGEIMVPPAVANQPGTRETLSRSFDSAGDAMDRHIVGSPSASINPQTGMEEHWGPIGDFVKGFLDIGSKVIGGVGSAVGSLFGGDALNVGMNIFGGNEKNPWGFLNTEVGGNIVTAIGEELLADDPVEQRLRYDRLSAEARRNRNRERFGWLNDQPSGSTAQKYLPKKNGLMPSRSIYTPTGA